MKKILIGLPLCLLLAYCSSTRSNGDTASSGTTTEMSGSATVTPDENTTADAAVTGTASVNTNQADEYNNPQTSGTENPPEVSLKTQASVSTNPNLNITNNTTGYDYSSNFSLNNPWTPRVTTYEKPTVFDNSPVTGEWSLTLTPEVAAIWRIDTASFDNYFAGVKPKSDWLYASDYMYGSATVTPETNTSLGVRDESQNTMNHQTNINSNDNETSLSTNNEEAPQVYNGALNDGSGTVIPPTVPAATDESDATVTNESTSTDINQNDNPDTYPYLNDSNQVKQDEQYISGSETTGYNEMGVMSYIDANGETKTWNNQYLIAANGNMYQMPRFNIYLQNGSFTGYTGCNAISGKINVDGQYISFDNLTPSTAIECKGGLDEQAFLNMLSGIDNYEIQGNEMLLKSGDKVVLRFSKSQQNTTTTSSGDEQSSNGNEDSNSNTTDNHKMDARHEEPATTTSEQQ